MLSDSLPSIVSCAHLANHVTVESKEEGQEKHLSNMVHLDCSTNFSLLIWSKCSLHSHTGLQTSWALMWSHCFIMQRWVSYKHCACNWLFFLSSQSDSSDMEKEDFEIIQPSQVTNRQFDFFHPNPFTDGEWLTVWHDSVWIVHLHVTYCFTHFQVMYLEMTIFQGLMWQVGKLLFKTLPYLACNGV